MPKVAVVIPFNSDEPWRVKAFEYVTKWYETNFPDWEIIAGSDGDHRHGWIKALAVKAAVAKTDADILVIADADCVCDGVGPAVEAVQAGEARWAVPHYSIRRLTEEATTWLYEGRGIKPNQLLRTVCKVYSAVAGGGITVIERQAYEEVPLDPRFHLTHGEDVAWATALKVLVGKPKTFRPKSGVRSSEAMYDLYHLYHPPIPPVGIKYDANRNMALRYQRAARLADQMRQLIDGAKSWEPTARVKVYDSETTCAVIVPVLNRPQNAAPFMRSFRSSCEGAAVYAAADCADYETIQAWRDAGARVLFCDRGTTFACKANYGYESTAEPWLLFVGDDVRFKRMWLENALRAAGDEFHLVSTNDLARNDLDKLAIHPLIRRTYIKDVGASWDGPGTVAHEGFRHWFVDMEWSQAAIDRGVYTYAPDSVVEHLHPLWKKSAMDDVYKLGMSHRIKDQRLYDTRYRWVRRKIRG